jgi:hypothetical protein
MAVYPVPFDARTENGNVLDVRSDFVPPSLLNVDFILEDGTTYTVVPFVAPAVNLLLRVSTGQVQQLDFPGPPP